MCSALTQEVTAAVAGNVSADKPLHAHASGRLPDLGSVRRREHEHEAAAAAGACLAAHRAAVRLRDLPHEAEPEADAAGVLGVAGRCSSQP